MPVTACCTPPPARRTHTFPPQFEPDEPDGRHRDAGDHGMHIALRKAYTILMNNIFNPTNFDLYGCG
jgi:hypothetical protein